jgi:proteasome accessory factor C
MVEHKKLYRIFQLISRLRAPFGALKSDLARDFDVTERTIERYFVLLRDLGFNIEKRDEYFCIPAIDKYSVNPEDLIVFSVEEAAVIRDAIIRGNHQSPLHKSLLTKLYALTDIDELSETLYHQNISKSISTIRKAIKEKEQVLLKSYHSVSSNRTSDRLVEPIRFVNYYTYFLAFEVSSKKVKQFKTDRLGTAEPTGSPWQFEKKHGSTRIDAFGMSGTKPIRVKLKLSPLALRLLEEEHPFTSLSIRKSDNAPILSCDVYSFEGVGRFIMGLLNEIEILEPDELKIFVEEKVLKWKQNT